MKPECTLGPNRDHVIPPSCISPAVLVGSAIDLALSFTCLVRMASGAADRATQRQRFATRRSRCRRIDSVLSNYSTARYASVACLHQSEIRRQARRTVSSTRAFASPEHCLSYIDVGSCVNFNSFSILVKCSIWSRQDPCRGTLP